MKPHFSRWNDGFCLCCGTVSVSLCWNCNVMEDHHGPECNEKYVEKVNDEALAHSENRYNEWGDDE